ncbi:MAG: type II toxin-antitoxin system prevent-host-death family antitoxin [Solirubrobacteraceae bacterium]|nr:type II toxin-antitoxin system prevent-host-death family antitoxin [Patulibacter sp.]
MTDVTVEELSRWAEDVVGRVEAGESFIVTSNGRPVACVVPHGSPTRRRPLATAELLRRLEFAQADSALRAELVGGETDELGPIA